MQKKLLITGALCCVPVAMATAQTTEFVNDTAIYGGLDFGADVIVGDLHGLQRWASIGGITAYSVGTVSCNIGDTPLLWIARTNEHPVIAQNMFRVKEGVFEQIGQSWLKHGFVALQQSLCQSCQAHPNGSALGVGCSDPYSAGLNGTQYLLGPRSEVNASNGFYPYPWILNPATAATIGRRVQVFESDLESTSQTTTRYFIEGQYVAADDARAGNNSNNNSYREVTVEYNSVATRWELALTATTQRKQAAIRAWQDVDPAVVQTDVNISNDGLMILAAKATDVGGGTWEYEYALQNLTSHRSAGSFSVPLEVGTVISDDGFHDVEYHSGEVYNETDWTFSLLGTAVTWSTQDFSVNENANALRWGTLYNFRFRANAPPQPNNAISMSSPAICQRPPAVPSGIPAGRAS